MKSERLSEIEREGEEAMKRVSSERRRGQKAAETDLSVSTYGRQSQKDGMIFGGLFL